MQKAIYFMPDISGFTDFVNSTEVEHSIHIISELLELLLDNTIIDLQLVEIEGDALFMFTSKIPTYENLLEQIILMQKQFHKHTKNYATKRICNCGSCKTTINLNVKFLVHYGDLSFIKVKKTVKPYGIDVIKIHKLLKNEVPVAEYILFTDTTYDLYKNEIDDAWTQTDGIFDTISLKYFYKTLEEIETQISKNEDTVLKNTSEDGVPFIALERTIHTNIQTLFNYISELKYRHLWEKDLRAIRYDSNRVNRTGTEHTCVLKLGNLKFETISSHSSDSLIYGEKTKDILFTKNYYYLIKLHKIDENSTKLNIDVFLEFSFIGNLIKTYLFKKFTKMWEEKSEKLINISRNNYK
jgi:hypothetical protein